MAAGRLIVVGCGTVVPEGDRGGSAYFVDIEGACVLLDCGPGTVQTLARLKLPWDGITDLVITHFHADHVGALPGLFFSFTHGIHPPRADPLRIWGPAGTRRLLERLSLALGDFMLDPGFPVVVEEIEPGGSARLRRGLDLGAESTPHTEESLAYRLDGMSGSLGYTGDTGLSDRVGDFLAGVDIMVSECSLPDEQVGDNHLSPAGVARMAGRAGPGVLLLTHVYPHFRNSTDVAGRVRAAGYAGPVELAAPGKRMVLGHRLTGS